MLSPDEQGAFLCSVAQVRQASERQLRANPGHEAVIHFVAHLHRGVSRLLQTALEQGLPVACQPGCHHCCHARVEAMAPEIFRIAREVQTRTPAARQQIVDRLLAGANLPAEAGAWHQRPPCAFLEEGYCSIYELRPSTCRKAHSLDVTPCQASAPDIPQDLGTVLGMEALSKGTAEAYGAMGLSGAGHELGAGVLLALSDPGAEARWHKGEAVFAPAETAP